MTKEQAEKMVCDFNKKISDINIEVLKITEKAKRPEEMIPGAVLQASADICLMMSVLGTILAQFLPEKE